MVKNTKETYDAWLKSYNDQVSSGKTITCWCEDNNVAEKTFKYRRAVFRSLHLIPSNKKVQKSSFTEIECNTCSTNTNKLSISSISTSSNNNQVCAQYL